MLLAWWKAPRVPSGGWSDPHPALQESPRTLRPQSPWVRTPLCPRRGQPQAHLAPSCISHGSGKCEVVLGEAGAERQWRAWSVFPSRMQDRVPAASHRTWALASPPPWASVALLGEGQGTAKLVACSPHVWRSGNYPLIYREAQRLSHCFKVPQLLHGRGDRSPDCPALEVKLLTAAGPLRLPPQPPLKEASARHGRWAGRAAGILCLNYAGCGACEHAHFTSEAQRCQDLPGVSDFGPGRKRSSPVGGDSHGFRAWPEKPEEDKGRRRGGGKGAAETGDALSEA